jgi:beta-lactamase class A
MRGRHLETQVFLVFRLTNDGLSTLVVLHILPPERRTIRMTNRREFSKAACAAFIGYSLAGWAGLARADAGLDDKLAKELARLEAESGGRLGVAVLDTQIGASIGHRADEPFPMCSTFKVLAAAAILRRVDAHEEKLDRRIGFTRQDLVPYSPVTERHLGGDGMSLAELCEAAVTRSDNTAANLLLASMGGPANLTAFVRTLGDQVTRLDRIEPDLNEATPGDPRDTTTPNAMVSDLQKLVLGEALSSASRDRLTAWMVGNKTGDARLRAGLPAGWRVGDKTGSGARGTANDVAVIWPAERAPIIVSVYLTGASGSTDQQNATIAAVARAVSAALIR